jgi:SAF domain
MSTTLTRVRSNRHATPPALRFRGSSHRRRPTIAVASLALVTLCVAIFTSLYLHAGNRVAVLAVAHDVPQGHIVTSDDLAVVSISISAGLSPVSARDASRVVGRRAAVSILRGTLLSLKDLAVVSGPARGRAVVGVATKAGQLPAGGVSTGDTVDVILTGSPATLAGGSAGPVATSGSIAGTLELGGVLASNATVTGVAAPSPSSPDTIVVSVLVPSSVAPLVASASAAGQAALVLVGPSS